MGARAVAYVPVMPDVFRHPRRPAPHRRSSRGTVDPGPVRDLCESLFAGSISPVTPDVFRGLPFRNIKGL